MVVQEGVIHATIGKKKLSKPIKVEIISKDKADEATDVTTVKFDEAKVKEVESGKVVSTDIKVENGGMADELQSDGNGGYVKPNPDNPKPTEPTKPTEHTKPVEPSKPDPVKTTQDVTDTESIGFDGEERANSSMTKGETRVVQNGSCSSKLKLLHLG